MHYEDIKAGMYVAYNGLKETYLSCSDPSVLVVGKPYLVTHVKDLGSQTNITFLGIEGEFNSVWFDAAQAPKERFFILARKNPKVGERMAEFAKIVNNKFIMYENSSTVMAIIPLVNGNRLICTKNSEYELIDMKHLLSALEITKGLNLVDSNSLFIFTEQLARFCGIKFS